MIAKSRCTCLELQAAAVAEIGKGQGPPGPFPWLGSTAAPVPEESPVRGRQQGRTDALRFTTGPCLSMASGERRWQSTVVGEPEEGLPQ
jgi:hypothetical protein